MDREAQHAAVHGDAKSRPWLSDWTELLIVVNIILSSIKCAIVLCLRDNVYTLIVKHFIARKILTISWAFRQSFFLLLEVVKYYKNYHNVTETQSEQMLLEKWCRKTCMMQSCHKQSVKNTSSAKPNKVKCDKTRYACILSRMTMGSFITFKNKNS